LPSFQKSPAVFVGGRGLLLPGEFITSVNVTVVLLYHSLSEGATICVTLSIRITWKPENAGAPDLFSLPHRANTVAEYLGTVGPHTYFSVVRLMITLKETVNATAVV